MIITRTIKKRIKLHLSKGKKQQLFFIVGNRFFEITEEAC